MDSEDHWLAQRVLVLAPFGRDAAEVHRVLTDDGLVATCCANGDALCREIRRGAAAALVAEEALNDAVRLRLTATLAGQPPWSDFPLLVMTSRSRQQGDDWSVVRGLEGTAYLSLLDRPLHVSTLVSAVRTATQARQRQYQVRDELAARRRAEEALRRMNETLEERVEERTNQVRDLASRFTMAEQEERRRISQILHDDLQQILFGIGMKMSLIHRSLQTIEHPHLAHDLDDARAWVDQAITTTRQLSVDLSPPILEDEGLANALDWLQRQMQDLHRLTVTVEAEHNFYLPDEDLRVFLFQAVRELLFNVRKHAGVDRARVLLEEAGDHLVIHVIDEGRGFDVAGRAGREDPEGGLGLFSVRERLRLLGGRLEVQSQPGAGTHIEIHAPLPPAGPV